MHINKSNTLESKFPLLNSVYPENYLKYEKEEIKPLWNKHISFIKSKIDILPAGPLYLDSFLHDSKVLSIQYDGNNLSILFDDYISGDFFPAMAEYTNTKMNWDGQVLPVAFNYKGINQISLYYINKRNKLRKISKTKMEKYLQRLSYYLHDEVIELEDDAIYMGILFWAKAAQGKRYLLLEIKSKKLVIDEFQKEIFLKLFGGQYENIFIGRKDRKEFISTTGTHWNSSRKD